MNVPETPAFFNDEKTAKFLRLVLKGRSSPVPKWQDFNEGFLRCMGIKVLRLEAKQYRKPQVDMLVFQSPIGRNFRPLGIKYILNVLYLLNFVLP